MTFTGIRSCRGLGLQHGWVAFWRHRPGATGYIRGFGVDGNRLGFDLEELAAVVGHRPPWSHAARGTVCEMTAGGAGCWGETWFDLLPARRHGGCYCFPHCVHWLVWPLQADHWSIHRPVGSLAPLCVFSFVAPSLFQFLPVCAALAPIRTNTVSSSCTRRAEGVSAVCAAIV